MADISITRSVTIEAPAATAWAVMADYDRDPEWRDGVSTMAPQPPGEVSAGTTTAEVIRFGGRTYRNAGEVTAVDPGRSFSWRTTSGADAKGSRAVRTLGGERSEVTLELLVRPHGSERLLRPVLARMLDRGMAADLDRLAALVAVPSAHPAG
ncbi:MAG: SRPBCC family protein [Acidimicrobiales bacterium]